MSRQSFEDLEGQIFGEYVMRGYSIDRALDIAQSTAGEIANRKRATMRTARRPRRRSNRTRY